MTGSADRSESGEGETRQGQPQAPHRPATRGGQPPGTGPGPTSSGRARESGGRKDTGRGARQTIRFHNFPCPACGSLSRPLAVRGGVRCSLCGEDITGAVLGMARVSMMSGVRGGTLGFAACGRCGGLVIARRELDGEEGERWLCTTCGELVFV